MLLQTLKSLLTTSPPPVFHPEWTALLEQNLACGSTNPAESRPVGRAEID